jgi:AAA family ATP:ADP antiporter
MSSTESKALEASVDTKQTTKQWSSMTTESKESTPSVSDLDLDDASNSLVRSRGKQDDDEDNLYAHADDEDEDDKEDAYYDIPLSELRGSTRDRILGSAKRALLRFYKRLYGDQLPPSEMVRTLCLAMTLFFMIGGYWLLRSLKDSVLMALCGYKAIPKAKMLSVFVVLGVVSVYNRLLDSDIPKHQLFYIFGTFYFFLFTAIALLLMDENIGLANKYQSEGRILGWVSYCSIESFGSVMVSLFWSFAHSNISLETAKSS